MNYCFRLAIALTFLCFALPISIPSAHACTTAVISGRATIDGRPILWKNRDSRDTRHTEVIRLTDGKLKAIAIVNAGQTGAVWMGVNEAGFCIENSLARDLATKDKKSGPGNGGFMKRALQSCATVEDFKALLEETDETGRRTIANYGVIDAKGGAAIFETGPKSHVMFDANDPKVAPDGILVRANFSTAVRDLHAKPDAAQLVDVFSQGRYLRACSLLKQPGDSKVGIDFVLRNCTRDLMDSNLTAIPGSINAEAGTLPSSITTSDTISRAITVSAAVFHGVRPGEDPSLTTMWVMLGEPIFAIAVPCWVSSEEIRVELTGERGSPLGEMSNSLRTWNYQAEVDVVDSKALKQLWSTLWPIEDAIVADTLRLREAATESANPAAMLTRQHNESVSKAYQAMQKAFLRTKTEALKNPGLPLPDFSKLPPVENAVH